MAKSGWGKPLSDKEQDRLRQRQRDWTKSSGQKARARAAQAARNHMERQTDKRVASGSTWSAIAVGPIGGGGVIGGAWQLFGGKSAVLVALSVVAVIAILAWCMIVSRRRPDGPEAGA